MSGLVVRQILGRSDQARVEVGATEGVIPGDDAELRNLRAEVGRLSRVVGGLAMSAVPAPTGASEKAAAAPDRTPPIPESARLSKDDVVARHRSSPPDVTRTREIALALEARFKKDSFATAQIAFDEVDCRGATCRVRVSFAEEARSDLIVAELAGLFPDGRGFHEPAEAGEHRRMIISHHLETPPAH